jgi:hypothetical protein
MDIPSTILARYIGESAKSLDGCCTSSDEASTRLIPPHPSTTLILLVWSRSTIKQETNCRCDHSNVYPSGVAGNSFDQYHSSNAE